MSENSSATQPLIEITDLEVTFTSRTSTVHAVREANLTIMPGQTVAVVGESGSGKSTTAHAIINLLPAGGHVTGGSIKFEGEELVGASKKTFVELRGKGIGLVPQDPMSNLNPVYRIGAQVRESLKANGIDSSRSTFKALTNYLGGEDIPDTPEGRLYLSTKGHDALFAALAAQGVDTAQLDETLVIGYSTRMEVQAFLDKAGVAGAKDLAAQYVNENYVATDHDRAIGLLAEAGLPDAARRARQYPHEFSGGMRQRALIAIGLSARPKLLIADEPTSALDVTVQRRILDHLGTLTRELGTAVLFITHDLGLAAERAEHVVVMYHGQVVESGPSMEILTHPQHPYTKRLVAAAPSLASHRIQAGLEVAEHTVAVASTVREQAAVAGEAAAHHAAVSDDDIVLDVQHLTKVFTIRGQRGRKTTDFKAVDDVSFRVPRGTTTALVGESGSGKSTTANMLLGLLEPTNGDIFFRLSKSTREKIAGNQAVPLSEAENFAKLGKRELFNFRRMVQPIFQDPYGSLDPMYSIYRIIEEPLRTHHIGTKKEREAKVRDLLDKVALPQSVMRRYPNELSGGQRQRIAVARALALDPEVVVCDEAVSALDVLVQAQILELLDQLQKENGYTYLFITHDLAVVRQIADDVCVMREGKLVEHASVDEVFEHPREDYTRALLDAIPGATIDFAAAAQN